jgi:hypothetical protein
LYIQHNADHLFHFEVYLYSKTLPRDLNLFHRSGIIHDRT